MKRLYAPWRSDYSKDTAHAKTENATQDECIFCLQLKKENDDEHFIVRRFKHNVVMLNLFPYNAGHLLIMPFAHVSRLHEMSQEARTEMMELMTHSVEILKNTLDAHGVNIGTNLGKAAGAGIPSHLHTHVLPRFFGDTNFLPALAQTKQISFDLHTIYKQLKTPFANLSL